MATNVDGAGSTASFARLPVWARNVGVLFFIGSAVLFARLIWEQTVWTWERGPQMVGFSLAHGGGVVLLFFPMLLFVWAAIVIVLSVWQWIKKKNVSRRRWAGLGLIVLLFVLGSLPEGFWERVFIGRMAASPYAGDLMLYAAYRGDFGVVQGLVAHGVSANATDRADWKTAVHGAAAKGDIRTLRYLASKGANINALDRSGDSPLEVAIANHQDAAAKFLLELGAKRIRGDEAQRQKAIHDQVQDIIAGQRGH
jgi:Ankyrin repeats (3 copies)